MIKVNVKVPGSLSLQVVEVAPDGNLEALKEEIAKSCNIPVVNQRIIFRGVAICENFPLTVYGIKNETKVAVVKKNEGETDCTVLKDAMLRYLRQFYNENDSAKITREFMIYFYKSMVNLSLDDLEKFCASFLKEEEKMGH